MVMMEQSSSEHWSCILAGCLSSQKRRYEILRNNVASQVFQLKRLRVDDAVGLTIFLLFQMMQCNQHSKQSFWRESAIWAFQSSVVAAVLNKWELQSLINERRRQRQRQRQKTVIWLNKWGKIIVRYVL